jgi:hypothetical protein
MRRFKTSYLIIVWSFAVILTAGCGPKLITKEEAFPNMYKEHPVAILVLPPINETTAADAKEYYSATIAEPLSFSGHYVYPIEMVSEILKNEGMYDTELILNTPLQKFKEYFGADAVMFVKIKNWETSYYVIGGNVTVGVEFLLKSTSTGEQLWKYAGTLKVDTTGENRAGGLLGLALQIVETAVKTATTDYVPIARRANFMTLNSIPFGKYHERFNKDQTIQIIQQKKEDAKK